jgi:hypothetical protein
VEVFEGIGDFGLFCAFGAGGVKLINFGSEVSEGKGGFGEECLRGELFDLFVLYAFTEEVLLDVRQGVGEKITEVVAEELLQEERLHLGKYVNATLFAVESLELSVVLRPVPALAHHK